MFVLTLQTVKGSFVSRNDNSGTSLDLKTVNYNGVKVKVNTMFIENPKIGEFVLVHAGCAIQKIDENYAKETLDIFKELSDAIEECNFNGRIKRVEK